MGKRILTYTIVILAGLFVGNNVSIEPRSSILPECQYPYRAPHPNGGCDNSDPADPVNEFKNKNKYVDEQMINEPASETKLDYKYPAELPTVQQGGK